MTLNCGSSSVKYALFDMPDRIELCHETVEGVATGGSFLENHELNSQKYSHYHEHLTHGTAIGLILDLLTDRKTGVLKSISEISAVGHRVVHGGKKFTRSVIIDDKVIKEVDCLEFPASTLTGVRY